MRDEPRPSSVEAGNPRQVEDDLLLAPVEFPLGLGVSAVLQAQIQGRARGYWRWAVWGTGAGIGGGLESGGTVRVDPATSWVTRVLQDREIPPLSRGRPRGGLADRARRCGAGSERGWGAPRCRWNALHQAVGDPRLRRVLGIANSTGPVVLGSIDPDRTLHVARGCQSDRVSASRLPQQGGPGRRGPTTPLSPSNRTAHACADRGRW